MSESEDGRHIRTRTQAGATSRVDEREGEGDGGRRDELAAMTRKSRNSILKPRKLEEMFDSLSEDDAEVDVEVDVGGKRKRESTVPGKMEVSLESS